MGDAVHSYGLSKNSDTIGVINGKNVSKKCAVTSGSEAFSENTLRHVGLLNHGIIGRGNARHVALFLLKVATLELVRRFSRAKCPSVWRGLQALQVLCYPPFKWIQRWAPFKGLVKGMQMLSRPLLVLSIATAFSDQSQCTDDTSDGSSDSHGNNGSHECSEPEPHAEPSSSHSAPDTRIFDVDPQSIASEKWLQQLYKELERQGISLPERINEDELRRFYTAVNGDFSHLLSSIKKTIYWRKTYYILSVEELEMWSNMVFWHGFDVKHRPCLIVRLGLACFSLPSHDRPRFAQAVARVNDKGLQTAVSQIEHGVLHLVDTENPQITVLVDCEGLSPMRFPMQIMRSCSSLLQDHFPNRLGCLFVIRLPPVVRVVAQTFIQVLKPITRQKLRFEGEMYQKVLSEQLQTLPSYLGGKCACTKCSKLNNYNMQQRSTDEETRYVEPITDSSDDEGLSYLPYQIDDQMNDTCDQVLRTAVMGVLMFWVFMAVMAGLPDLVPMR